MLRLSIFLFSLAVPLQMLHAQDVLSSEIIWRVDSLKDLKSESAIAVASNFVTKSATIEWIQKNGAKKYEFNVTATSGSWTNVNVDGEILFNVTMAGKPGKIKIIRNQNTYSITLEYAMSDQEDIQYEFHISSFEIQ